jgi:hypothetical protein
MTLFKDAYMTSSFTARAIARVLPLVFAVAALGPATVGAQTAEGTAGAVHLGPVDLTPRIGWRAEYDDNVFRSSEKISDMVSRLGGSTEVRTRMRRLGITGNYSAQWVHYATLVSERGANLVSSTKVDFAFNRFIPYVSTAYDNSRDRIYTEIDTRPRTERLTLGFGGVVRLGGKTGVDISARRTNSSFDGTAVADGVNLGTALNRSTESVSLSLIQDVTPLTHLTFGGEIQREIFDAASFRSADESRIGVGFQSDGRIKGSARAGLRLHRPHDPALPESRGIFVSVATTMMIAERLNIGIGAQSDLAPSYRPGIAYFDSSSFDFSLSYAVHRSLRLSGTAGMIRSDYTDAPFVAFDGRLGVDTEMKYGSGISYLVGETMSIDFSGEYVKRTAPLVFRRFDGVVIRAGVSHAF